MFRQKTLYSSKNVEQIQDRLYHQVYAKFPFGKLDNKCFVLYKTVSRTLNVFFYFRIKGTIEKCGDGTKILYTIRPSLTTIILFYLFWVLLFYSIVCYFLEVATLSYMLIGFTVNAVFDFSVVFQTLECIRKFEDRLQDRLPIDHNVD